jgi:hypothetical protein
MHIQEDTGSLFLRGVPHCNQDYYKEVLKNMSSTNGRLGQSGSKGRRQTSISISKH